MARRWLMIVNAVTLCAGSWLFADTVNTVVGEAYAAGPTATSTAAPLKLLDDTTRDAPYEDPRRTLDSSLEEALTKLDAKTVRAVPYFEGNQAKGFKLYAIPAGSVLASIGLRNGDVLERVNGYDVTNPEQALQVYRLVKDDREFDVEVARDGRVTTLHYPLR